MANLKEGGQMKSEALAELEKIRKRDPDGLLRPEKVVKAAKAKKSPLHDYFTWDNTEAAKQWRLTQAKQLIRVAVTILPRSKKKVRAYVSLPSDRTNMGGDGGYRSINEVLAKSALRTEMMEQAYRDLRSFTRKYDRLREELELRNVFTAIDQAITLIEEEESEDE